MWEEVDSWTSATAAVGELTERMRVPGGWLVKVTRTARVQDDDREAVPDWRLAVAVTFIPDPAHEWAIGR